MSAKAGLIREIADFFASNRKANLEAPCLPEGELDDRGHCTKCGAKGAAHGKLMIFCGQGMLYMFVSAVVCGWFPVVHAGLD